MTFVTSAGNESHIRGATECGTISSMPQDRRTVYYATSRYTPVPCEHCRRAVRHERWCIMINRNVYYAYLIVSEPDKLTLLDELILHSLGVSWTAEQPSEVSK